MAYEKVRSSVGAWGRGTSLHYEFLVKSKIKGMKKKLKYFFSQ
jgi:hypothetical protein